MKEMMDKLMELKKEGKRLSSNEKEAKMNVLGELGNKAGKNMVERLKGMKKVSVMSDSPEGLKEGLDTAEELVEGAEGEDKPEDVLAPDYKTQGEEEMAELDCSDMSDEELDANIQALMMEKASRKA